jgi:hypothetical protein
VDRSRLVGILATIGAAILLFIGGAALKWYVWDIAIRQAGEPDRSMLFWGLPIAFIGVTALGLGAVLVDQARRRVGQTRSAPERPPE